MTFIPRKNTEAEDREIEARKRKRLEEIGITTRSRISALTQNAQVSIDLSNLEAAAKQLADKVRDDDSIGSSFGEWQDDESAATTAVLNGTELILCPTVRDNENGLVLRQRGNPMVSLDYEMAFKDFIELGEKLRELTVALPGFEGVIHMRNSCGGGEFYGGDAAAELALGIPITASPEEIEKAVREVFGAYKNAKITG